MIGIYPKARKLGRTRSRGAAVLTKRRLAALIAALALAAPSTAAAAGPSAASTPADAQYDNGPGFVAGGGASASGGGGGSLPFTGFDAGVLAAIGGGLLGAGLLLYRRQRPSGERA